MRLKCRTSNDTCGVLIASINQMLGHFQEVREGGCMNKLNKRLEVPSIYISPQCFDHTDDRSQVQMKMRKLFQDTLDLIGI